MPKETKLLRNFVKSSDSLHRFLDSIQSNTPDIVSPTVYEKEEFEEKVYYSRDEQLIKRGTLYFDWIKRKTSLISGEKVLNIPPEYIPRRITQYACDNLSEKAKQIVMKHYKLYSNSKKSEYKISEETRKQLTQREVLILANDYIFTRSNVVWVDFGFNIGTEFGGRHPAIILKKAGANLIVLPLSSKLKKNHKNEIENHNIIVDKVFSFPKQMTRYTSVNRITSISPSRIVFTSFGSVSTECMNNIDQKIIEEFVLQDKIRSKYNI